MAIDKKLIDQLQTNYKKPEDIIGEKGLLKELTKAILERALAAEMTDHLGYEKHDPAGLSRGRSRMEPFLARMVNPASCNADMSAGIEYSSRPAIFFCQ